MSESQQYATQGYGGISGQLDPQGIFTSVFGGALGGLVGKYLAGSTGQKAGSWAGRALGSVLSPFEAGPTDAPPSDLEMQGFWSVVKKIGQVASKGVQAGHNLGLFQADQPTSGSYSNEQMMGFLQQALPALQALAQQQQMAGRSQ